MLIGKNTYECVGRYNYEEVDVEVRMLGLP